MKRIILLFALLTLSIGLFSCGGGGGSGSADVPPGENPGGVSSIQLWPSHYIAQINTYITLYAKVLDGNGMPVPNINVTFTNLSVVGSLSATSAKTDGAGLAKVTITSTSQGFSTILVEVNKAAGISRDSKTVFFSPYDTAEISPALTLDVDGDNDGIYNESSDFTIFENTIDNQVIVRATVFNGAGLPFFGSTVVFGSDSTEVTFPLGSSATTDINGQASVLVQIDPSTLSSLTTTVNITAVADNGAANIITLFLNPVTISSILVTATPTKIEVDQTSDIVATVTTSAGTPAPNGTIVGFTANCGLFNPAGQMDPPFYQITAADLGTAKSTFQAPSTPTTCEVKATSGGVTGSVFISVIPPPPPPPQAEPTPELNVVLADATVGPGGSSGGGAAIYTITGGTGPYTVTTSHPGITLIDGSEPPVTLGSGVTTFTVTNTFDCGTDTTSTITVTITVVDSAGATKTANYIIDCSLN